MVTCGDSSLAQREPDDVYLGADGSLQGWRSRCGTRGVDICFYDDAADDAAEHVWPTSARATERYQLSWDGEVEGTLAVTVEERFLYSVAAAPDALYAVTRDVAYQLHRLDQAFTPSWSLELLPAVYPPEVPIDGPIADLLRANDLAYQQGTEVAALADGALMAIAVARGSIEALNQAHGLSLPLPADPLCSDILLVHVPNTGRDVRYWLAPSASCERLPKLAVVGRNAFVASWVRRPRPPEPNDTYEYDIGLTIFDLETGAAQSQLIDLDEDDIPHAIAACGANVLSRGCDGQPERRHRQHCHVRRRLLASRECAGRAGRAASPHERSPQ